ncbi:MAG: class I SAM-dependent methyltransferase [Acidobacteria bacterium]|nr:class I SAM-dependent methyltransferase [Acidobacteriota bacterium]
MSNKSLTRENRLRDRFVSRRLGHKLGPYESTDLTRFTHGAPGRLLACRACRTLLRDESPAARYEDDPSDPILLRHLYPRYLQAFRQKRLAYQHLLRPGAEVLEIGSHLGAFLQTAEEWGWRPTGLDIGKSASAFARQQGLSVKRQPAEDYMPHLRKPEAIFIWNCFEQLDDPAGLLRRTHQLLGHNGLLIIRVPNAAFYRRHRDDKHALKLLGYNNLLGFPYLYGYTPSLLRGVLEANHFQLLLSHNSSLLTPPYPDLSSRIRKEWQRTSRAGENLPNPTAPWIELVTRRAS